MGNAEQRTTQIDRSIVVDTTKSPHAKLRSIPIGAVKLNDRFWRPRLQALQEITLLTQYDLMEQTGRIDNFRRAAGKIKGDFRGLYFNDSDVYKWIEAATLSLSVEPNKKVADLINRVIAEIVPAQDENGYLNTFFTFDRKKERWTNLRDMHELYCAGHLFQAAVAHHRVTGDKTLLNVAVRFADHIAQVFGLGKKQEPDGHPEVEMALVELYRETDDAKYLQLAQFFIDQRGHKHIGGSPYLQDHKPFRELDEVIGHAVRALYLNAGSADLYAETGEQALMDALKRIWRNLTEKRLYVTGGCGARHEGEAFGTDYELPNARAYAETCAAIANILWNWRMLLLTGEAGFMDVLELSLFNGALSGIGLDGKSYFYVNPLADRGGHRRQPYFDCACCPPNIARLLAMVPSFLYAISADGIFVNLYANSMATITLNGTTVTITQQTDYPWDGEVSLTITPSQTKPFALHMRIPSWCEKASVKVNGQIIDDAQPGSYLTIRREWKALDIVHLSLVIAPEFVVSHPHVESNRGQVAIKRGPIVYCLEQTDNPDADVWDIAVAPDSKLTVGAIHELPLQGAVAVLGDGIAVDPKIWDSKLYLSLRSVQQAVKPVRFTAIPYFAWANRQAGPMTVWLKSVAQSSRLR